MKPLEEKKICVPGGAGFLGRVVCDRLRQQGAEVFVPRSADYDLTEASAVAYLFSVAKPDVVIHLAAEVGGIGANQRHPGRFFYANLAMGLHLIEEARRRGIERFVQVGSVCGYPKHCPIPFEENDLWNGFPEETNAPYGVTKRILGVMLEAYKAEYDLSSAYLIPVNLFGPGDNFDLETSHVIPAMIRKFDQAVLNGESVVTCWGSGNVSREFLYVDDVAEAIVQAAAIQNDPIPINLGTGREIKISELAGLIARLTDFEGQIKWDKTKPDGQPRRCLSVQRAKKFLGWQAKTEFDEGLRRTIDWWRRQGRDIWIQSDVNARVAQSVR